MELKSTGFKLRTWRLGDAPALQKFADNRSISDYLLDRFPSPYTIDDAISFIGSKLQQRPALNFAIEVNKEAAGIIGLEMRTDIYRKTPLLGYWLAEPYWGKSIMPEVVKLITTYAFEHLDIICIQANVLSKNPNSMRVLEKVGYEKQGILKHSVIKNNEVLDEHVYAIDRRLMPELAV